MSTKSQLKRLINPFIDENGLIRVERRFSVYYNINYMYIILYLPNSSKFLIVLPLKSKKCDYYLNKRLLHIGPHR